MSAKEKPFVMGLTGGIGSGKTLASDYFASKHIKVVDADVVAREVVEPGSLGLEKVEQEFGAEILNKDGTLNRALLRNIVFSDSQKRTTLESILHPLIRKEIIDQISDGQKEVVILVSPLLFETDQASLCDKVLVIDANVEDQVTRTASRDGVEKSQVETIVTTQMSRSDRINKADVVIENSGSIDELYGKLETFLKEDLFSVHKS